MSGKRSRKLAKNAGLKALISEHRSQIRRVLIDSWVGNLEAQRHIVKDEARPLYAGTLTSVHIIL